MKTFIKSLFLCLVLSITFTSCFEEAKPSHQSASSTEELQMRRPGSPAGNPVVPCSTDPEVFIRVIGDWDETDNTSCVGGNLLELIAFGLGENPSWIIQGADLVNIVGTSAFVTTPGTEAFLWLKAINQSQTEAACLEGSAISTGRCAVGLPGDCDNPNDPDCFCILYPDHPDCDEGEQ